MAVDCLKWRLLPLDEGSNECRSVGQRPRAAPGSRSTRARTTRRRLPTRCDSADGRAGRKLLRNGAAQSDIGQTADTAGMARALASASPWPWPGRSGACFAPARPLRSETRQCRGSSFLVEASARSYPRARAAPGSCARLTDGSTAGVDDEPEPAEVGHVLARNLAGPRVASEVVQRVSGVGDLEASVASACRPHKPAAHAGSGSRRAVDRIGRPGRRASAVTSTDFRAIAREQVQHAAGAVEQHPSVVRGSRLELGGVACCRWPAARAGRTCRLWSG